MGPVFDAFGQDQSKEDSLKAVLFLVSVMGILALCVWICAYLSYYFTQVGALNTVRYIKKAYFEAILLQESAWFDKNNYTKFATEISADCSAMETGIG